jgi:hypothetical protein
MPPRRSAHLKGLPLTLASTAESLEARVKRLRPSDSSNGHTPNDVSRVGTPIPGVASASAGVKATPTQGLRSDAPAVRNVRRGSFSDAAAELARLGVAPIIDDLVRDRHARSSIAAYTSWLNTWRRFHDLAFRGCDPVVPMFPVTPRSLVHVAALFKSGGYRAFANYLSALKSAHIEAGFEWDQLLAHTGAWTTRSVLRGIGPARQSCSFWYDQLCTVQKQHAPLVVGGPHSPMHFTLLACIFLLREVEASNALVSAWSFNHDTSEITWLLPSGKSDHLALGTRRTWGCLCEIPGFGCPFHLALEHWSWLLASPFWNPLVDGPLFPAAGGGAASKAAVVCTFEAIGTMIGQPLLSEIGMRLFGGHSPRVTGAQLLAAAGVEISKVRILARHSGDAILRYVADAPLKSLRSDLGIRSARVPPGALASPNVASAVHARIRKLEAALTTLQSEVQTQASDVVALATGFARTDDRTYIQNTITATIHCARSIDGGHAICGWRFATARRPLNGMAYRVISTLVNLPGTMICERCMPTERAVALSMSNADEIELSGDES